MLQATMKIKSTVTKVTKKVKIDNEKKLHVLHMLIYMSNGTLLTSRNTHFRLYLRWQDWKEIFQNSPEQHILPPVGLVI